MILLVNQLRLVLYHVQLRLRLKHQLLLLIQAVDSLLLLGVKLVNAAVLSLSRHYTVEALLGSSRLWHASI